MLLEPDYRRLLLDAGHGEYLPVLHFGVTQRIIFDPSNDNNWNEADEELAKRQLAAVLPEGAEKFEPYDPTWCMVIELRGPFKGLSAGWEDLLADVESEPSGDDDAYDYWPSGCRLLWAMAQDLDEIDMGDRKTRAVAAIEAVLEAKGPEFVEEVGYKVRPQ